MGASVRTILVSILMMLLACGCDGCQDKSALSSGTAPGFSLKDLNGRIHRLKDLKGEVVVLNFFATWCGPCRQEIPELVRLYKGLRGKGVKIIGVSLDPEPGAVLGPFISHYGITYPVLLGTREVVVDYGGITGIPTTFVIDRNGTISDYFVGMQAGHVIEKAVKHLLEQRG